MSSMKAAFEDSSLGLFLFSFFRPRKPSTKSPLALDDCLVVSVAAAESTRSTSYSICPPSVVGRMMSELVIHGVPAGLVQGVRAGPRPTLGTCYMGEHPRWLGAEPCFMKRSLLSQTQDAAKAVLLVVKPDAKSGPHDLLLTSIRSISIEGQVPGPTSQL